MDPASYARSLAACRTAASAGNLSAALAHALAAVEEQPGAFEGLFYAAVTLQGLGRLEECTAYYERAIRANGDVAEAHHNLARALLALRRFDPAVGALTRALELRPDYSEALDALGFATAELGAPEEALSLFERSLQLNARDTLVHNRLGNLLLRLQRYPEAQARFETALTIAPESAELLAGLGVALDRQERTEEAIVTYRRALANDPALANTVCNLGKALLVAGDVDAAMECFDRAIALEPRNGSFYLPLVIGGSKGISPAHVEAMRKLGAEIESLPHEQQIDLHFALGSVYERAGDVDDAFHHLSAGNALKRADIPYDEPAARAYVRALENAFERLQLPQLGDCGDPSERPIFIVGMPRSGSTLVEQLLAAHPAVNSAGEIGVLGPIFRAAWPVLQAASPEELREQLREIGERYLRATGRHAGAKARLTDKTLENVQLLPLVEAALPNARIVHIRRDDLDSCFSCFATFFADHRVPFTYDLRELGHAYRDYLDMMDRQRAAVARGRLLEVSYERLVDGFETEARRIVDFCGLPWDAACLAFHNVRRDVRTASNLQIRQPLYDSSIGRAQPFLKHLTPLIEALNLRPDER